MSNPHLLRHLESRIADQKQDLQTLLLDNQRLAASHVALKQELASSHADIQILTDTASKTRAERDAEIRGLIEKLKRREEDGRRVEGLKRELERVRMEAEKLEKDKMEMEERASILKEEAGKANEEAGKVDEVKREIEYMRHEVERGRAAIEYEKKIHKDNLLHRQRMEENMVSMASEVEQLRSEFVYAEKRAHAVAAAASSELVYAEKRARAVAAAANPVSEYPEIYGSSGVAYGGSTYTTAYGLRQFPKPEALVYTQFPKPEAPASQDGIYHYATAAVSTVPYSMQQAQARR